MLRNLTNVLACPLPKFFAFRRISASADDNGNGNGNVGTEPDRFRVTVVGAAGGIGQPLSLLLRLHPLVSTLKLYDLQGAKGVCADLSHIDRPGATRAFEGRAELLNALRCTDIVVVAAGMPRKPGQTRDDLFEANASIVAEVADAVGIVTQDAFLAIITNPINSTVPIAAEVLKKRNAYNPALVAGITTLDVVRARKFIADCIFVDPRKIKVPVIGGHSGNTIVPLISQADPAFTGDASDIERITQRVQNAGTEVVEAKAGNGSATLSMAYAAANFVNALLIAKSEKKEVREVAYVESCLTPAKYFASDVIIGPVGIVDALPLPELSPYEDKLMCDAMPVLLEDIKKGTDFGLAYAAVASKAEQECGGEKKEEKPMTPPPTPPSPPPPPAAECKKEPKKEQRPTAPNPPCPKKTDKSDSCEELVRQMKNAPCRKAFVSPKKEENQNSKCGASDSTSESKTDSPSGNTAYNPCDDLSDNNDKTTKK